MIIHSKNKFSDVFSKIYTSCFHSCPYVVFNDWDDVIVCTPRIADEKVCDALVIRNYDEITSKTNSAIARKAEFLKLDMHADIEDIEIYEFCWPDGTNLLYITRTPKNRPKLDYLEVIGYYNNARDIRERAYGRWYNEETQY